MPKIKPVSQILGNGRGAFRKALLSVLLRNKNEIEAVDVALGFFGHSCVYCGISGDDQKLQPDFLWPETQGGSGKKGNLVPACPSCNSRRGSKNWERFLLEDKIINTKVKKEKIKTIISEIKKYMKKYDNISEPSIDKILKAEEILLRENIDNILDALTQGIREKIGDKQKLSVKFENAGKLLDQIIVLVNKNKTKLK